MKLFTNTVTRVEDQFSTAERVELLVLGENDLKVSKNRHFKSSYVTTTGQHHRLVFRRNTRFSQQHFLFRYSLKASSCAVKLVTQHGFLGENGFFHFCDENEPVVLPNAKTELCPELGIAVHKSTSRTT